MKRFWGFVIKEFLHIFRDKRSMLILFGMPIAQILIFGYVVSNDVKNIKIAVFDKSKDEVTTEITNKIISSGYFVLSQNVSSDNEIDKIFKKGNIKEVLIFEANFAQKLEKGLSPSVQIITDASDGNIASISTSYTSAIINDYLMSVNKTKLPYLIKTDTKMVYNPNLNGVFMFIPGTMALILILVSAMMTSISITKEKEIGTMEVLLVSPLKPAQIVIGKVLPYIALAFINAITIIILGLLVFGMPVKGSLTLLLFENLLYIIMALSLGIFISTIAKNMMVAMFISMFALMLPTMLLSGFIFPVENMPKILQVLTHIMPPTYFIIIVKNIMIKGTGIMFVLKETLILLGMTGFFIFMSIKKFKIRLE